jgi:hypothetical protein
MTRTPILVEALFRAWGTDDPRVLPLLRAENRPGSRIRPKGKPVSLGRLDAVRDRARAAGWPDLTLEDRYKASTAAVQQLEGVHFEWNSIHPRRDPAAEPVTIFDE